MIPQVCFSVFKKIQNYFEQHRRVLQLEYYDSTYDSGSYPKFSLCHDRPGLFLLKLSVHNTESGKIITTLLINYEQTNVKSLSCVRLFAAPWTVAYQAPPSVEFSRQKYWSGLPFPSPGDFPNPGIEPRSPALQADALPTEPPGKPKNTWAAYPFSRGSSQPKNQTEDSCIAGGFFTS